MTDENDKSTNAIMLSCLKRLMKNATAGEWTFERNGKTQAKPSVGCVAVRSAPGSVLPERFRVVRDLREGDEDNVVVMPVDAPGVDGRVGRVRMCSRCERVCIVDAELPLSLTPVCLLCVLAAEAIDGMLRQHSSGPTDA